MKAMAGFMVIALSALRCQVAVTDASLLNYMAVMATSSLELNLPSHAHAMSSPVQSMVSLLSG